MIDIKTFVASQIRRSLCNYIGEGVTENVHCKDISVRKVDRSIDEDSIASMMDGWVAYKRAQYVVLNNGDQYAVVRLTKSAGGDLFRRVVGYEIISMPEDTVFVERPDIDVINIPAMAKVQSEHPGKAVVVRGMFSHLGFVKDLAPLRLRIVDCVPPRPSKMSHLVGLALSSGYIDKPIVTEEVDIDLSERSAEAETAEVMFPCEVSGASSDRPHCFLDQVPDIAGRDITLVGCRLSRRIFRKEYGRDVPFINICPRDNVPDDGVVTIVKCCRVKEGHEREGNIVMVPWGVTVPEIVGALNDVFGDRSVP